MYLKNGNCAWLQQYVCTFRTYVRTYHGYSSTYARFVHMYVHMYYYIIIYQVRQIEPKM